MAESYISELGDKLSHGVANTDGRRVKIIAPKVYDDGNGNHPSISTALSGKEDKSNKVTTVRASSSATDTAYPSEKAVASALSDKASKQVRLSFTLAAAPSGGVSTKYVKIYAAGSDYRHWECSYNGTTGSLYAAWLFRSYATGENSRDNVTLLKTIDTVARAWYSAGASTWYVKFEHASTTPQYMTFNVAALDTSALPTLEAVDTLPSGATELTVNGVTMAEKLVTARQLAVDLSNTSTNTSFNGTANVTNIKVSGTLPVANGGTGATTAATARTNLDVYSKSETDSLLNGKVEVVASLPATGTPGVIYYVGPTGSGSDQYEEYIWDSTNSQFIKVGDKSVDLSNYVNTLSASGTGSVVTSISKSGNTLSATIGNIAIDNLSDWASKTDVTVSSVTYHTYWPVAPTSSNQVYGISIKDGKLYQVYNNKGTYSVRPYDRDTTYTNAGLGQGYGTCSTAESTAEKAVTLGSYAQTAGGIVAVKFTNAICAAATLKVNGTTAKPIYIKGAAVTANNKGAIAAGDTAYFMYDGSYYHFLGTDRAATNPIVNITRSGTTFTATRLDGSSFTFTQQDNNTTYTQEKLGQGYATCTTAAATAAKEASLANYELVNGGVVAVKFTNALCADATLAINGQAAKYIFINGAKVTATSAKEVLAGDLAFFMYDGTQYQFICTDRISKEGITGLSVSGRTVTYTKADGTTGTITTQDTTYTFDGTYNASTNKAATVSTVTNAVNALDVDDITGFGAGKTLATLTETDGKIAATFQNISITSSQISDKTDSYSSSGTVAVTGKAVAAALGTLDYDEVGGDGKYISKIKETDGKISATVTTMDTTPTASSTNAVTSGGIKTALDLKAPLASPALTGTPTAPTAASGTNTTQIATTAFVNTAVSNSSTTDRLYANAKWGGDFRSSLSPGDTYFLTHRNVFFGLNLSAITVEYSTDGGTTWTDYGLTDTQKYNLFNQYNTGIICYCGKNTHLHPGYTGSVVGTKDLTDENIADQRLRITICCENLSNFGTNATTGKWIYCNLRRIGMYMTTNSATRGPRHCVFSGLSKPNFRSGIDTWTEFGDYALAGDSGWNSIPCKNATGENSITFGDSFDTQFSILRFEIWSESLNNPPNAGQTGNMGVGRITGFSELCWTLSTTNANLGLYGIPCIVDVSTGISRFTKGIQFTSRKLAVNLANTATDTSFDGSADQTGIKVSGTLPIANGGTGQTTANNAANALLMGLPTWTADPSDNVYLIRRDTGGSESFGQVKFSTVWNYINGKLTSVSGVNISGNAATADKLSTARSLKTDLSSTTAVTFDGSADQNAIPITGTLDVAHGGTGATTLTSNALVTGNGTSAVKLVATNNGALYATSANGAAQFGTLPIAQGGTGATTNTAAEYNLINNKNTELSGAPQDTYRFAFLNTVLTSTSGVIAGYRTAGTIKTWVKDFMSSGGTSLNATNSKVTTATTTKLFLTGVDGDPTTSGANKALYTDTGIYATTTSGELNATQFKVNEHCTMQYNSTKSALDFVFS